MPVRMSEEVYKALLDYKEALMREATASGITLKRFDYDIGGLQRQAEAKRREAEIKSNAKDED